MAFALPGLATDAEYVSGPDHVYVNGDEPEDGVACRLMLSPTQTGELLVTLIVVTGLTTTVVVAVFEQPLLSVTVTLYSPAIAALAPERLGF